MYEAKGRKSNTGNMENALDDHYVKEATLTKVLVPDGKPSINSRIWKNNGTISGCKLYKYNLKQSQGSHVMTSEDLKYKPLKILHDFIHQSKVKLATLLHRYGWENLRVGECRWLWSMLHILFTSIMLEKLAT